MALTQVLVCLSLASVSSTFPANSPSVQIPLVPKEEDLKDPLEKTIPEVRSWSGGYDSKLNPTVPFTLSMLPLKNVICCSEHPNAVLIEDYRAGDQICSDCGKVVGDRVIDVGTEWRTFSDRGDQDPSRVGAAENPLLNGSDLSTMIGPSIHPTSFDDGAAKYTNKRTVNSSDRTLLSAFREIDNMAARINLPRMIVDRANLLFKQ
ncbi:unnamed protein product, partial [Cyprideis torosa]